MISAFRDAQHSFAIRRVLPIPMLYFAALMLNSAFYASKLDVVAPLIGAISTSVLARQLWKMPIRPSNESKPEPPTPS